MIDILKQLTIILYALLNITAPVGAPLGNSTSTAPSVQELDLQIIQNDVAIKNYISVYMSNLAVIENSYYVKNGNYLQRFKDKELPVYSGLPQIEVHEYVGPRGDGYQAYFKISKNGHIFEKSVGVGPEAISRNFEWR